MTEEEEGKAIKIILLGDCGVGKTCIISRYMKDEFNEQTLSTNGASYAMKSLAIDNEHYRLNIWDTAGQEKYRSVTKMFIQDTSILILVYSIVDRNSFQNLDYWYNIAVENCSKKMILGVIGNKSDLYENEAVSDEEGKQYAEKKEALFKLVSAKNGRDPIESMFLELLRRYDEQNRGEISEPKTTFGVGKDDVNIDGKQKKKCCIGGK